MPNVFDYLDWRGDLSFAAAPFNEVDNLILSFLSYLDLSDLVLEQDTVGLPLGELAPLYLQSRPRGSLGLLLPVQILDLLEGAALTPRFAPVRLWGHRSRLDEENVLQFSATAFSLGTGETFVAYRGTDDTLTGWEEDFHMTIRHPIPAQEESVSYLDFVAAHTGGPLLLGGHSKGGNLAMYAAARTDSRTQSRIRRVWNNDGPGFPQELLDAPGLAAVRDRICAILPRSSVVGTVLFSRWEEVFVESSAVGFFQHNGLTWQVLGDRFVRTQQSKGSQQAARVFSNLLQQLDMDQRRDLIRRFFSIGEELGARTLTDLTADGRRGPALLALSNRLTGLDPALRESLLRAARLTLRPDGEG